MSFKKLISIIIFIGVLQFPVFAHLDTTSLSVKGGENFKAHDTVTITWKLLILHYVFDKVSFSSDSGKTWTIIDSVAEKSGVLQMSCKWIVPAIVTKTGRIRVFQTAVSLPGTTTNDYTLLSPVFSILIPASTGAPVKSRQVYSEKLKNDGRTGLNSFYGLNGRKLTSGSNRPIQLIKGKVLLY